MKSRILNLFLIWLFTCNSIFSQWIQTDGPYGSTNINAFIIHDSLKIISTNCGLFTSVDIRARWNLEKMLKFSTYTRKGDSLFVAGTYSGVALIDLSQPEFPSADFTLWGINSLISSDSCLFAGTDLSGFYKSIGFSNIWESHNDGLPVDSGIIPPKLGGGKYYHRFVYSIDKNSQYIFAGTQRGVYRTVPNDLNWESINTGLPLKAVTLIKNIFNSIYICIDKTIYGSPDNGGSWEMVYTSASEITSINEIEKNLYITSKGDGITLSTDTGKNWNPLNKGLSDLHVNFIGITDTILVCGTSTEGFYYYEQGRWRQNNSGIICSSVLSIVAAENSVIANDYDNVYRSDNGNNWIEITPDLERELFWPMAVMGDTVFLSVEYDTPEWPYDQPYILYTPDTGKTWKELNNPVPFARDDPYRIYCDKNRLYAFEDDQMCYTDDLGSSWTVINLPEEFCNYFYDFLVYNAIPYATACGDAELVKLNENGNWILSNTGLPSDRPLSGLAYCEGALFAYVDVHGLYVSEDDGNTWNKRSGGLNLEYGSGIRSFVPSGKDLFISTENGIYYTDNYGQDWYSINSGLPNRNIGAIMILNDTLFAGTGGNGIWKCAINKIPKSNQEIKPEDESVFIYPNPASDIIRISNYIVNIPVIISIFDLAGRKILSGKAENYEFDVSGLRTGTYIITIVTEDVRTSGKLVIVR